jgi:signal transduction histidine kinase/DNA-binding NarL/FixJ family response regulator
MARISNETRNCSDLNNTHLDSLVVSTKELDLQNLEKDKRAHELVLTNIEKDKRAEELLLANIEKDQRAEELVLANKELEFQNLEKDKRALELVLANIEKDKRAEELLLANIEKDQRAEELVLANKELEFQNLEKDKRAHELALANIEKDKRAEELLLANIEKDQRAEELVLANKELEFQNLEKDKRANELILANIEKDRRADELVLANKELEFQNLEKDKRANELILANIEKDERSDDLVLANKEKDKRADELILANKEKDQRASELLLANIEKYRRADELVLANEVKVKQDGALANFREKSRFFAKMSHEMRTPLNGILAAIQLLDDGQLISEQQKFLDAARISGDILLEHINNVLIIERNDNSQLELCDISMLTSDILTTMNPLAVASKHLLCLDKRGLDDRKVITDRRAVQQILMNLISNAIKFSSDGDIKLRVFYGQFKDGNLALHLEVSDSGPGISQKDIERIFDDFVVLDNNYARNSSGTGLGLGIVRTLARRLGGDIRCESTIEQGSRFIVSLNVTPAEENNLVSITDELPVLAPLKLLVVDDNEINRILLEAMLKRLGHKVTLAEGGHEAVALTLVSKFDAILMDISMPKMNGFQATQAILNGGGPNRATPIIPVTAHAQPEERSKYIKVGMLGFIEKPVKLDVLTKTLFSICSSDKSYASPKHQGTQSQISIVKPLLNERRLSELLEIIGRDNLTDLISDMIQQFEDKVPSLIDELVLTDLDAQSHDMAGVSNNFGAERMHSLLYDIEVACKEGDFPRSRGLVKLVPSTWQQTRLALQQFFS